MALPRLSAYVLTAVTGAQLVAAAVLLTLAPDPVGTAIGVGFGVLALVAAALGMLVAVRRPGNVVGPLLVLVAAVVAWLVLDDRYGWAVTRRPGLLPASDLYLGLTGRWMFLYVPAALLMLYFPDGRLLPGPRWRWVVAGMVGVPTAFTLLTGFSRDLSSVHNARPAFSPPPEPYLTAIDVLSLALLPGLLALLVASAAAMVVRYRRATDEVCRAQVKWFALGASFLPATLLLCWASYLILGGSDLVLVGLAATFLAIVAATAIAILRHDLYDVDRAVSAAVTYGLVTSGLLGIYTVASFVGGLTAGHASPVAAAAATAVCAVVLAPLRRRLQRQVDRRFYPLRGAALTAIERLRSSIHAGQARPEQLQAVLRSALADPHLRVGYRLPGSDGLLDTAGAPMDTGDAYRAAVRLDGHDIGALVRGTVGSRELLREVATAAALLVEVVRLRIELSHALSEVESSRARLLHAGYQERRRLERDLHDGAQQRLVSLGMAMRVAQRHLHDGTVDVKACSTSPSPNSERPSPSCARSPTGCARAASTTGWAARWRHWPTAHRYR